MRKTMLKRLRTFAKQTNRVTTLWTENDNTGFRRLTKVGDENFLNEWLENNKYDQRIYSEGKELVEIVKRYRELEGDVEISKGRRL